MLLCCRRYLSWMCRNWTRRIFCSSTWEVSKTVQGETLGTKPYYSVVASRLDQNAELSKCRSRSSRGIAPRVALCSVWANRSSLDLERNIRKEERSRHQSWQSSKSRSSREKALDMCPAPVGERRDWRLIWSPMQFTNDRRRLTYRHKNRAETRHKLTKNIEYSALPLQPSSFLGL